MLRAFAASLLLLISVLAAEADDDLKAMQGAWVIEDAVLAGRDHKEDFAGMKRGQFPGHVRPSMVTL